MALRRFLMIAPLALIAVMMGVLLYGRPRGPQRPVSALMEKPVPLFELPGYDAAHPGLAAADLRRGTVTVVNVFASWCLPCRVEAPQLAALSKAGVVVHGVAVRDSQGGLATFFHNYGNPFRRIGMDGRGAVSAVMRVEGLPETFVVDGRGVVRWHHRGDLRAENLAEVRRAIEQAR